MGAAPRPTTTNTSGRRHTCFRLVGRSGGWRRSGAGHDGTPAGIAQELYALLTCYQIVRIAITDAIEAAGGIDPDRGSFTIALNAARDLLTQATGVIAGTVIDLIGAIGRRVLDNLLPDRRLRVSRRAVKRAISKYQARGPNIHRRSYKATLEINILTAGP
jgi:hypothetical protein